MDRCGCPCVALRRHLASLANIRRQTGAIRTTPSIHKVPVKLHVTVPLGPRESPPPWAALLRRQSWSWILACGGLASHCSARLAMALCVFTELAVGAGGAFSQNTLRDKSKLCCPLSRPLALRENSLAARLPLPAAAGSPRRQTMARAVRLGLAGAARPFCGARDWRWEGGVLCWG